MRTPRRLMLADNAGGGGFSRSLLSPAALYDFSAPASVTLNVAQVSQIDDLSGNGIHLVQATGSAQPTYVPAGQNGLNIGYFSGAMSMASSANLTRAQPFMFFMVVRTQSFGPQFNIFGGGGVPEMYRKGTGEWGLWAGSGGRLGGNDDGAWHVVDGVVNDTSSVLGLDGVNVGGVGAAGTTGFAGIPVVLGNNGSGNSQFFNGWFGEGMICPIPSNALRDAYRAYLKAKWGTP